MCQYMSLQYAGYHVDTQQKKLFKKIVALLQFAYTHTPHQFIQVYKQTRVTGKNSTTSLLVLH